MSNRENTQEYSKMKNCKCVRKKQRVLGCHTFLGTGAQLETRELVYNIIFRLKITNFSS